ncbi:IS3 family transposase [Streptomyces virginiae]|uniref:IS3 family transposase n=1 Tax=Streptomyces virginiae TaxID=1961 RepID=UPI0036C09C7F
MISEAYEANYRVHGARKIQRVNRQGHAVARCTVERLMREPDIAGALRGKRVITALPGDRADPRPGRPEPRRRCPEPLLGRRPHPRENPGRRRLRRLRRRHLLPPDRRPVRHHGEGNHLRPRRPRPSRPGERPIPSSRPRPSRP